MGATRIEWAEAVWNPVTGCTKVSEGCRNCYAERMAKRLAGRFGYPKSDPFKVTLHPERLEEPLRWTKPRMIFVCSMGDLFHPDVPLEFIAEVFDVMACATPDCGKRHRHTEECWAGDSHTFLILTKRPERMKQVLEELPRWVSWHWPGDRPLSMALEVGYWPLPNVWLGVSVENQHTADERIPVLLQTPATVRFVSCEPLLGPIDLSCFPPFCWEPVPEATRTALLEVMPNGFPQNSINALLSEIRLDWIIVGGETGPGARPMAPKWVRLLRDQCQVAGVPFFFKQWGEWGPSGIGWDGVVAVDTQMGEYCVMRKVGKKKAGALLDGREWREVPSERKR